MRRDRFVVMVLAGTAAIVALSAGGVDILAGPPPVHDQVCVFK